MRSNHSILSIVRYVAISVPRTGLLCAALTFGSFLNVANAQERSENLTKWTDISGEKTVEASFVKLDGVNLVLRKSDGKEITLPLSRLDSKSRLQARAMAKGETPSSPASKPSGESGGSEKVVVSPPVAFPTTTTPQEFVDIISMEFKKENPLVLWDALPASKQKQVQDIVKIASTKIEQRTLDQIKRLRGDVLKTLKAKKQFVLNSKEIPIPPDQKDTLVQSYDSIVNFVDALIPANLLDAKTLGTTDLRTLVGNYVGLVIVRQKLLEQSLPADSMFRTQLNSQFPEITVQSSTSNQATVVLSIPGQPAASQPPMTLVLVEGRWLPEDLVSNWDKAMQTATATLKNVDPKTIHQMVGQFALGATGAIGTISSAETQEDFDSAIQLFKQMIPGAGGPPAGPPGAFR